MRILHVIPDLAPSTGGPVTAVLGLAEAQAALGQQVTIASTDFGLDCACHVASIAGATPARQPAGCRRYLPGLNGVDFYLFSCRLAGRRWAPGLGSFLARNLANYDVVMVAGLWQYPTWIAGRLCRQAGTAYVVSPHGMLDSWSVAQKAWKKRPYLWLLEGQTLRGAAALHATSQAEAAQSHMAEWNRSFFVLPLGLRPSCFTGEGSGALLEERYPALAGRRFVLFLGRLHYKKQPDVVVRAFSQACAADPEALLVLAGPGDPAYVASLEKLTTQLGIGERTIFTGMLDAAAARAMVHAAGVFVLPSHHENFGIAAAEAMAAGCPVIVSEGVDLGFWARQAEAGIVTPASVQHTAQALRRLLSDPALRARLGANGRRLMQERFCWDGLAHDYLQVLDDILSGRRTSHAWCGEREERALPHLSEIPQAAAGAPS